MSEDKSKSFKSYEHHQLWMSGLTPKLGLVLTSVDAKAIIPILGVIFFANIYTITFFLVTMTYYVALKLLNIPPDLVGSKVKAFIAGKNRYIGNRKLRKGRFIHDR